MATPGKNKTNFKTYEASTRLLAAVIATTNVKLDYAELAKHVGGGATKDAINHRLRPIKQLAKMQVACIRKGEDPGDLPIDKGEIQKLFGESTPSGIEWQFRDIKNLGKAQQDAVKKGENPATLPVSGTPAGRKKAAGANTPGSGATARTPGTGARGRKRTAPAALAPLDSDESDGDPETPTKRPVAKKARTTAATPTPHKSNGNITTPNYTPTKTTIDIPAGVAAAWAPDWAPDISSRLNGASTSATVHSTEAFNNGAQMSTTHSAQYHVQTTPQRVTNLAKVIKKEPTVNTNPFLGAIHISALNEGDDLEDGEI